MKKALIHIDELAGYGYRVAQVEDEANTFPVAEKMFWYPCPEETVADLYYYDPGSATVKEIPVPENSPQPISQGAQNL